MKEAGNILQKLHPGTIQPANRLRIRVNQLIDELILLIGRKLTEQNNLYRDFPQTL